jgi:hypothetical protein
LLTEPEGGLGPVLGTYLQRGDTRKGEREEEGSSAPWDQ